MTHTTQVLSERQIKDFIDDGLFLDTPNAIARAIESATLKAVSGQDNVKQRLFQLLNGAAGDGLIINEIDAAELFTDLFPEHIEFITRGAIPDATLPPAQKAPVDEREAFEAWAKPRWLPLDRCEIGGASYRIVETNLAWCAWQARAALQCAQAPQPTKGQP